MSQVCNRVLFPQIIKYYILIKNDVVVEIFNDKNVHNIISEKPANYDTTIYLCAHVFPFCVLQGRKWESFSIGSS